MHNVQELKLQPSMEDVVIVGAGIAGLATSLSLHRLGIRSIVLESANSLRTTGFALTIWANGWRALAALGIADVLRQKHNKTSGVVSISVDTGLTTSVKDLTASDSNSSSSVDQDSQESRCVIRKTLLETLQSELPEGVIRFSSKVVHIETQDRFNVIHLADGTVLKTKVLIGCDGVNSVVSKFLGFRYPSFTARSSVRGIVNFENGHDFDARFMHFFGEGVRFGVIPPNDHSVFWGLTFNPSSQEKEILEDPAKLKQLVLSKLGKVPDKVKQLFEKIELDNIVCAPLRYRRPWELLWRNIAKDNICVLGDALHPMTPDLGQGGCSALEESVVLARFLAEAFKGNGDGDGESEEHRRIQKAMEKFAKERRWRSFDLVATAYLVGWMQQSEGAVMHFLRDKLMAKFLAGLLVKKASFDCGKLVVP